LLNNVERLQGDITSYPTFKHATLNHATHKLEHLNTRQINTRS